MNKLLRYFGYIPVSDLLREANNYAEKQYKKRKEITEKSVNILTNDYEKSRSLFIDGLQEGYKGIGVSEFITEYLKEE